MTVRQAKTEDIPQLLAMGRKFHEAAQELAPYSEVATESTLIALIEGSTGVVFIADRGMIGGALAPAYCADDWTMAVELFWWSEGRDGLRLLTAFEQWAGDVGANEVRMTSIKDLHAASKILSRRGYQAREISHKKVIKWH